jgi:NNP family nitrate/nitrite transporter-like MFS transporter
MKSLDQASPVARANTPSAGSGANIEKWDVEDNAFWESTGKRIAYRNLMISVPALLCAFAVWGMWGIITVQMLSRRRRSGGVLQ